MTPTDRGPSGTGLDPSRPADGFDHRHRTGSSREDQVGCLAYLVTWGFFGWAILAIVAGILGWDVVAQVAVWVAAFSIVVSVVTHVTSWILIAVRSRRDRESFGGDEREESRESLPRSILMTREKYPREFRFTGWAVRGIRDTTGFMHFILSTAPEGSLWVLEGIVTEKSWRALKQIASWWGGSVRRGSSPFEPWSTQNEVQIRLDKEIREEVLELVPWIDWRQEPVHQYIFHDGEPWFAGEEGLEGPMIASSVPRDTIVKAAAVYGFTFSNATMEETLSSPDHADGP